MHGALALGIALLLPSQCGSGGCRPARLPSRAGGFVVQVPTWEWVELDGSQWSLRRDGVQIGVYLVERDAYFVKLGSGRFADEASDPPSPIPTAARKARPLVQKPADTVRTVQGDTVPTGVQREPVEGEHFHISGREVPRLVATAAIESAKIPDWSGKLRLTIFAASKAEAESIAAEVAKLPNLSARSIVTDYDLSHQREAWVADCGFKTSPLPQVVIQDGPKVLERFEGPGAVAALRKADPQYDPAKDLKSPGGKNPLEGLDSGCILGGLALLLALSNSKKESK